MSFRNYRGKQGVLSQHSDEDADNDSYSVLNADSLQEWL